MFASFVILSLSTSKLEVVVYCGDLSNTLLMVFHIFLGLSLFSSITLRYCVSIAIFIVYVTLFLSCLYTDHFSGDVWACSSW